MACPIGPTYSADDGLHANDLMELNTEEININNDGDEDMIVESDFHEAAATPTFPLSIRASDLNKLSLNLDIKCNTHNK